VRISGFERHVALACAFAFVAGPSPAWAQSPSPSPESSPPGAADCRALDASEASRVLGYPVEAADEYSARGGICFFTTRAISQEGSLAYALVTPARLGQRRRFFAASARRCGGVAKTAPNASMCRSYVRLAEVRDLDAYFEARTDDPGATVVPKLGERAVAVSHALYVRRGEIVFECSVRRGGSLDRERSIELARLLLERTLQP